MSPSSRGTQRSPVHDDGKLNHHHHHHHLLQDHLRDQNYSHNHEKSAIAESTMAPRPTTPEIVGRGSFSSVREHASGLAQTFTSSKISSYAKGLHDDAISDDSTDVEMGDAEYLPPLTRPQSKLHGAWYDTIVFRGWKDIPLVRSRQASKSFSDIQALSAFRVHGGLRKEIAKPAPQLPGASALERLPVEILSAIVGLLVVSTPATGLTKRNADLRALLLTSKTLHIITLSILYNRVTVPHSRIFRKFLGQITANPDLGTLVRRLDFNHFNRDMLGLTDAERAMTHNLTGATLEKCLSLTPKLQEFLAQEHVGENLERGVLHKIFFELPMLQAVDFCNCTHVDFRTGFESLLLDFDGEITISRLSFHKTVTLPAKVFDTILPRLTRVTHLDVTACKITPGALRSIPATARITHLSLSHCRLPGHVVVDFLTTHPAVKNSLVVLNLGTDATVHEMLDEEEVSNLLPRLPKTLRSLSLRGSKLSSAHLPFLLPLTRQLEELAVGRAITVHDIQTLLKPHKQLGPHTLRYIDVSDFQFSEGTDELFDTRCDILKDSSFPLHVIEIAERPYKRIEKMGRAVARRGWVVKERGQRYWMVRETPTLPREDGYRPWKMGADSWGARKIPVAVDEVGGWFGYQMFAKK
jgi:hypothetical protein